MLQFKSVKFLFLPIAFALVSCSTILAQTSEVLGTSEVSTATSAPATITPVPTEEIPTALRPGNVEALTLEQQLFMDSEYGKAQQAWLTQWVGYWTTAQKPQRVFSPDAPGSATGRVYFKIMTDPRSPKTMTLVLESPDYPGVVMLPPAAARENMSPPPESKPNHEITTGNGPLQLSTTSRAELTQFGIPEGSSLAFINDEFMMVDPSGKIVGLVNYEGVFGPKGQWVSAETVRGKFNLVTSKKDAGACIIRSEEEMMMFRLYAKVVDTSSFTGDVRVEDLMVQTPPGAVWYLDWAGTQKSREYFRSHLDQLPYRIVSYCRFESGVRVLFPSLNYDIGLDIKVLKFIDRSGRISFLTVTRALSSDDLPGSGLFPGLNVRGWDAGNSYPKDAAIRENLMNEWVASGNISPALEKYWLTE